MTVLTAARLKIGRSRLYYRGKLERRKMKNDGGIREQKVERAAEYLQNVLLPLPPGGKLPSFRTLKKKIGCGQRTVEHALDRLRKAGLIRIEPWRGIYRVGQAEPSDEIRLIHFQKGELSDSTFISTLFRTLGRRAESAGRRITVESAGHRTPETIVQELTELGISRCIISGATQPDFAHTLKRHIPLCLELLPRHGETIVPSLCDSPDMTVMQMNYLFKLGYRRIGYLHYGGTDMRFYPINWIRLLDYYRLMAENGLKVDPAWVLHCSEHYENLPEGMERILHSDPPPEALITPGSALRYLYPWFRERHIRIGVDLAVFSSDDVVGNLRPQATTVTNNPQEIAETFWEMFQAAERGEKVESRYTKLFIRTGRTVPSRSIPV